MHTDAQFWESVYKTDDCWLWERATTKAGYGSLNWQGKSVYAHRLSYSMKYGAIPKGFVLDHKCRVKICVRPDHLRPVTRKQNAENLEDSERGVCWDKVNRKWRVIVGHNGKAHYGGRFSDKTKAIEVVRAKRNELFTHNDSDRTRTIHPAR